MPDVSEVFKQKPYAGPALTRPPAANVVPFPHKVECPVLGAIDDEMCRQIQGSVFRDITGGPDDSLTRMRAAPCARDCPICPNNRIGYSRAKPQAIAETGTLDIIHGYLASCVERRGIGAVIGAVGLGKSVAIADFQARRRFVYIIPMGQVCRTPALGLRRIVERLTGSCWAGACENHDRIIARLFAIRKRFPEAEVPLIVIDEAQYCRIDLLNAIRDIWDCAIDDWGERAVAIVLVGNETLSGTLRSQRQSFRHALKPILNRMLDPLILEPVSPSDDIAAVCAWHDVTDPRARKLLAQAGERGGLREVENLIEGARQRSADGGKPTLKDYRDAAADLRAFDQPTNP